jgi:hypothetical protein
MSFRYVIKHNLEKRPIFVKDLGKDGWCSMPPKNIHVEAEKIRNLHNMFSEAEIKQSKGLRDAISCGWFQPIEINFDYNPQTIEPEKIESTTSNSSNSTEIEDLKTQISHLMEMVKTIVSVGEKKDHQQKSNEYVNVDILDKIAKDIKIIKKNTIGEELDGYEAISPEQVAIRARNKINIDMIKDSDLNIKKESINASFDDLVENLDD